MRKGRKRREGREERCKARKKKGEMTLSMKRASLQPFPFTPSNCGTHPDRLVRSHPIYAVSSFSWFPPPYLYLTAKKPEEHCCTGVEMKPVRQHQSWKLQLIKGLKKPPGSFGILKIDKLRCYPFKYLHGLSALRWSFSWNHVYNPEKQKGVNSQPFTKL